MKNYSWCVYTYRHRRAFSYLCEKLLAEGEIKEEMRKRAEVHDLDKLLLYQFLDAVESQQYHIAHKGHHIESGECTDYLNMLEMVIDFESAPYTKPDKPMNAYDFVHKLLDMGLVEADFADRLFEIMHELGIDSSYAIVPEESALMYIGDEETVTEEMILLELFNYVNNNQTPELKYIAEKNDFSIRKNAGCGIINR